MNELLKKYESIDQSKLNEGAIKILNRVKTLTSEFSTDDAKNNKIAEDVLNEIMKKYPDSVKIVKRTPKAKPAPKKVAKAKKPATVSTAKKSGNNIMSVAKEIQKAEESWKEAMERAKQVLKDRREQVVQKQKTELEKLYALVKTKKELQGFTKSDIQRDALRTAKPTGARVVTKQGFTSNQHGVDFPNKLGRKYWETRDRHADRLAPNYPKDTPLLADGGEIESSKIWDLLSKEQKGNFITKYKPEIEKNLKLTRDIIFNSTKNDNWNILDKNIKNVFNKHIENKKFYFENIGKKVTWEDYQGDKRKGEVDGIDFNGNYIVVGDNDYDNDVLSPDEVTIKDSSKKKYWLFDDGGSVSNERMYNFLQDDLEKLEKAINEDDTEQVETFFSYWLGSSGHLKSLETKTNERMYNFLKDDLEKLEKAINDGDKEQIDIFFSYWGQHLESLKMANGGSLPFMTDPNFGNFQNTGAFANGGSMSDLTEKEFLKKYFGANVFTENPSQYFEIKKISSSDDNKVNAFVKELKAEGFTVKKRAYSDFTYVMGVKKKESFSDGGNIISDTVSAIFNPNEKDGKIKTTFGDKTKTGFFEMMTSVNNTPEEITSAIFIPNEKTGRVYTEFGAKTKKGLYEMINNMRNTFELGGAFMMTDLAGHTGGSDGVGIPKPLSGVSGTYYTGLVGETGAMSSGELFMDGGAMAQNQQVINDASQSYVNYYLGEGASQGIYKDGGSIPNNYEGRTAEDVWNNLSKPQRGHFLFDHVSEIEAYKQIEKLPNSELVEAYKSEWSSLDEDIKNRFSNHVREGQYAYGGKTKGRQSMKELYIGQIASLTGTRTEGVEKLINDNNLTDSELSNLMTGLGRGMISRSDFVTALVGEKGNAKQKEVVAFAKSDKAYKMANGGDVLPPSKTYGENIYKAMQKFNISDSEARKKYGQYTISQWNELLSDKMADGGGIRSKEELKKIFSEKEAIVKNLTPKQIAEMWNKNSFGVKEGISKPITIEEAKRPSMKIYLENLLIENELTEDEQAKYFADGGFMNNVYADGGSMSEDISECKKLVSAFCKDFGDKFGFNEEAILEKVKFQDYLGHGASVFVSLAVESNITDLKVGETRPTGGNIVFRSDINPNGITGKDDIARTYSIDIEIKGITRYTQRRTDEGKYFKSYSYGRTIEEVMDKTDTKIIYDLYPLEKKDDLKFKMGSIFADGGFINNVYAKGGEIADIQKMKKALIVKAKSKGIYENFGQNEVRDLQDKYGYTNSVREFDNWAMNFDLSQMADGGNLMGVHDGTAFMENPIYADRGSYLEDNDGFMKADNEFNYRYPTKDVYIETLDEPIDLTDNAIVKIKEVSVETINDDIDLNEDGRVKVRMGYEPEKKNPEKFGEINPRAFEFMNLPMPTSNEHKND